MVESSPEQVGVPNSASVTSPEQREALADLIESASSDWQAEFRAEGVRVGPQAEFVANLLLASSWLAQVVAEANPRPGLLERFTAAKAAELGDQLRPDELTDRVRVELENAFARGALWQHYRGGRRAALDDLARDGQASITNQPGAENLNSAPTGSSSLGGTE